MRGNTNNTKNFFHLSKNTKLAFKRWLQLKIWSKSFSVAILLFSLLLIHYSYSIPISDWEKSLRSDYTKSSDIIKKWKVLPQEYKQNLLKSLSISYIKCYYDLDTLYLSKNVLSNGNTEEFVLKLSDYYLIEGKKDIYNNPLIFSKLLLSLPIDLKTKRCEENEELKKYIGNSLMPMIKDPQKKSLIKSSLNKNGISKNPYIDNHILYLKESYINQKDKTKEIIVNNYNYVR